MFGIGQFAQVAKVSVRTLRHYDDLGLLRPAAVDESTGYRSYSAAQLPLLNRILVLKDLGFTLTEITRMIEAGVSTEELIGMLRTRQAEAEREAEAERRRLSRVAARIEILTGVIEMSSSEETQVMTDTDVAVVVKPLDPVRVAVVSEAADGFEAEFEPIFGRLYPALFEELARCGVNPAGPTYGLYDARADGGIDVLAGVIIPADATVESNVVQVRDLPAAERAATLVHHGSMESVAGSFAILDGWIEAAGESPDGFGREVYLDCPDNKADWVTELQFVLKN